MAKAIAQVLNKHIIGKNKNEVIDMFDAIAPNYDKFTSLFSLGIDHLWRKDLTSELKHFRPQIILDVACGTGSQAKSLMQLHPKKLLLLDPSEKMINIAKNRLKQPNIEFYNSFAENIPLSTSSVDAVTISFGLRNFENSHLALLSAYRVLKPKGILAILEFGQPDIAFDILYKMYQNIIMSTFSEFILKYPNSFTYLKNTSEEYPCGEDLASYIETLGFKTLKLKKLTFGIAYLYIFQKDR
ncbi:MAG: ubiquinone/menaquinone biosynthesis methyltransferase [Bacteroidales bacterium]|jgi:demethylmenaquinone methyltransferase/2-methoxy-6-polyprenyl-1,4-benzoquinol methylase|nr:ubiquinone/menaquinone biosynthesis methyltransferase [Bacteroidales bacterium]MDI3479206.1 demethylmenaquinone methyltransferase / 2-methoxy-6-polyprenyl,4-benzoquinol methylase [Rikenellaceae bacterium]MDI3544754.1 demethylmenaquinone methyltransferase / 2-methoxy-6-polyprenyl,4-benzoquinol methylase [Rikenellaceae bacterium]MDN5355663.1 demethylmenaquinone methyltransferase / 2-methoxy-6-polyprenyl,4-benzoquinol methylase [Rikenellaceae bacterium]